MAPASGSIWTIVVAAGSGSRFGGDTPKQFLEMAGKRVVDWSVVAAASVSQGIVVVLPPRSSVKVAAQRLGCEVTSVNGGASRSESVRNGLAAVPADAGIVLVHDAARPVASPQLFESVVAAIRQGADAAIPVVPVVDTIRTSAGAAVDRSQLQAVQTPQAFTAGVLRHAHSSRSDATDDATLVRAVGGHTVTVPGERWNLKVTEPGDALVVTALLENRR